VSRRSSLPDRFGVEYRDAVLAARPRSSDGIALAWVLLDEAYRSKSTTVALGYGLLRELTHLYGRSLERGRNWLVEQHLVTVDSKGRGRNARTRWTLETTALEGTFPGSTNDRAGAVTKRPQRAVK
jgi:hypothetical protein